MSHADSVTPAAPASPVGARVSKGGLLVLIGCALFVVSIFLPVMRWGESEAHPTSGSARVFVGSGFTLADGGFAGTGLLAISVAAVVVLALAVVFARLGAWTWWVQLAAAVTACYYPGWVIYVFAKKWEDDVYPAEGAALLAIAYALIAVGLWLSRPGRALRSAN